MKQPLIILLLTLSQLCSLFYIFLNENTASEVRTLEVENRRQRDSLMHLFNKKQSDYEMKQRQLEVLASELVIQEANVKRSEIKLSELLKKRERHAQIENKRLIEKFSNYQLDSAFLAMYPVPDTVH